MYEARKTRMASRQGGGAKKQVRKARYNEKVWQGNEKGKKRKKGKKTVYRRQTG